MSINVTIEFNETAFIHNVTEEDIRFAFDTARFDGRIDEEESENKYLVIGFNRNANPIEVMYNVIDEDTINVFHAMDAVANIVGGSFLHYIKTRGEDNG